MPTQAQSVSLAAPDVVAAADRSARVSAESPVSPSGSGADTRPSGESPVRPSGRSPAPVDTTALSVEPPHRFAIRGGWEAADFELDFLLEPVGGNATLATFDWPLYPKSLLMKVAAPFLKGTMKRSTAAEAEGLKRYVEEGRSTGS